MSKRGAHALANEAFKECLLDVYRVELTGEAAFEHMLRGAETQDQKYIPGTMLQFRALHEIVKADFLPRYEELATLVTADEDAEAARLAAFMGDHERARRTGQQRDFRGSGSRGAGRQAAALPVAASGLESLPPLSAPAGEGVARHGESP